MEERLKQIEEAAKQEPKVLCNDKDALNYGSTTEACIYPEEPEILCNDEKALNYGSTTEECKYPEPEVLCKDPKAENYGSTTEECKYKQEPEPQPEPEPEPQVCNSSIWVYNNADEEITINVSGEEKIIQPGLYIEVIGDCDTEYKLTSKKDYKIGNRECKVNFERKANYPAGNGKYEIVDITASCVNTGKNYYKVGPLTASQLEASNLDYTYNPEAYIYAVEISATYNGMPIPNLTFVAVDEDGYIIKGANDKIASVQTDTNGHAYLFLYNGYEYTIRHELNEDYDKYDARNGDISYNFGSATVRKSEGFLESDILSTAKLSFNVGLSDRELSILKKVENETNRVLD